MPVDQGRRAEEGGDPLSVARSHRPGCYPAASPEASTWSIGATRSSFRRPGLHPIGPWWRCPRPWARRHLCRRRRTPLRSRPVHRRLGDHVRRRRGPTLVLGDDPIEVGRVRLETGVAVRGHVLSRRPDRDPLCLPIGRPFDLVAALVRDVVPGEIDRRPGPRRHLEHRHIRGIHRRRGRNDVGGRCRDTVLQDDEHPIEVRLLWIEALIVVGGDVVTGGRHPDPAGLRVRRTLDVVAGRARDPCPRHADHGGGSRLRRHVRRGRAMPPLANRHRRRSMGGPDRSGILRHRREVPRSSPI